MDKFVCVRLVQANALDLTLFQFDYDLTFAAFFVNADRTIYGRYGSRSDRKDATKDISIEGLRQALVGALDLHRHYPANKASLAGKQPKPAPFKTPDEYPSLRGKYEAKLDYDGKVVQSCMHCHQVREAERRFFRDDKKSIPDGVLCPYPMPDAVGLSVDPKSKAKVKEVESGSAAEKAGIRAGDELVALDGQPILSIADIQWVLHNSGAPADIPAQIVRGRKKVNITLKVVTDWRRRHSDIAWRTTTWDLRRMAAGGLLLEDATAEERRQAKLSGDALALRVQHVGEYGEHAVAKRAGFKKDDILLSVDGQTRHMTESQLLGYLLQRKMPGEKIPVTVLRGGDQINLELPMQ